MKDLLHQIKNCNICKEHLPLGPNPVVRAHKNSKIIIIGQAPGTKVHECGIPWNDQSGKLLRTWLNLSEEEFYDEREIAIIPMGFCYPGKGKSGDLPPRPECAPQWHKQLLDSMPYLKLFILIGAYAQKYYLGKNAKKTLTETVQCFDQYSPRFFPLPHPSPRNRYWMMKNPWFDEMVIPELRRSVSKAIKS